MPLKKNAMNILDIASIEFHCCPRTTYIYRDSLTILYTPYSYTLHAFIVYKTMNKIVYLFYVFYLNFKYQTTFNKIYIL